MFGQDMGQRRLAGTDIAFYRNKMIVHPYIRVF
jgi:hypothetical protein